MRTLKIALIGCGVVSRKHLKAIRYYSRKRKNADFRLSLSALIDPNQKAAEGLLADYSLSDSETPVRIFPATDIFYAAVREGTIEKPDIVAITTPSGLHYEQVLEALRNDCHVFVEKPITLCLKQAKELLELASTKHLKIAVGHIYRYFPVVSLLERELSAGQFGKALYGNVVIRWGHDQAYYDSAAWRGTRNMDGGAIMNQSIHGLDLMHWLLGTPEFRSAKGSVTRQLHEMEAEDLGFGIFEFADNIWLSLEGTTNTNPKRQEASFFVKYEKAEIRASIINKKISFSIRDQAGNELKNKYFRRYFTALIRECGLSYLKQIGNPHSAIYFDLTQAILYDEIPLADGQSGFRALQLVTALYQNAGVSTE